MSAKRNSFATRRSNRYATADSYELSLDAKEVAIDGDAIRGGNPANALVYDPGERQRIPKAGAWIMITRQLPPLEGQLDEHVRVGRVFYAEHAAASDEKGFNADGQYKVLVHSPWGDVWLWPYEYSSIDPVEIVQSWADGELIFHPMQISDRQFGDVTFYARSRGIPLATAAIMSLGSFNGSGLGWFEPHADLVAIIEGMEERVHRWNPEKHSRRTIKEPMRIELYVDGEREKPLTIPSGRRKGIQAK